jgi:hypothetical protein
VSLMREVLRRLVAVVCLYCGIALCLLSSVGQYRIEPVDWSRSAWDRQRHAQHITGMMGGYVGSEMLEDVDFASETRGTLEEFIAHETEGRLIVVSGTAWEGLWNDIAATVQGNAPTDAWAARRGVDYHEKAVYLPRDAGPLGQLEADWPRDYLQSYVRIDPVDPQVPARYLEVDLADRGDIRDGAPTHITYPFRTFGAALLLGGLLSYILLPRLPRPETGMFYAARAAGWLPDLLAAFGSGVFFGMPFLITGDLEGGPVFCELWPVTAVLWFMASIFAVIFVVTAWYQTRRVTWDSAGIEISTWGAQPKFFRADQIDTVGPYLLEAPRWLRTLAWIISILNWRAASSAMLLDRSDAGFVITTADGPAFRFTGDGLYGADTLLQWLDAHNVSVDADARALMETKSDYAPGRAGTIVAVIFALLALGSSGPFLLTTAANAMPQGLPEFRDGSFAASVEFTRPIPDRTQPGEPANSMQSSDEPQVPVTPEMLAREQEIIHEIGEINDHLKTLQKQIGTVSNPNAVAIEAAQKAMQRLKELQAEFDAVRRGELRGKDTTEPATTTGNDDSPQDSAPATTSSADSSE